jgi:hypothetical protein
MDFWESVLDLGFCKSAKEFGFWKWKKCNLHFLHFLHFLDKFENDNFN